MWGSAVRVRPGLLPGGLAQLARAPALQAGGQGFDSLALHTPALEAGGIFDRMEGKTQTNLRTLKHKKVQFTWKNQKQERGYSEKGPAPKGGGTGAGARQVPEGARGMPWLPEAKKDAAGCEKPRGGANGR